MVSLENYRIDVALYTWKFPIEMNSIIALAKQSSDLEGNLLESARVVGMKQRELKAGQQAVLGAQYSAFDQSEEAWYCSKQLKDAEERPELVSDSVEKAQQEASEAHSAL